MTRPRVLVVRPEPQASAMAARLADAGLEAVVEPLLEIRVVEGAAAAVAAVVPPPAGLVVTSAAAVAALEADPAVAALLDLPVLAVGPATAARARAAGFRRVIAADGDAEALLGAARSLPATAGTWVHVAGRDRVGEVAERLTEAGRPTVVVEAYAAEAVDRGDAPAIRELAAGRFQAVVAASARTSAALARSLGAAGLQHPLRRTVLVSASEAAASPLKGLFPRRILAEPGVADGLTKAVVALLAPVSEDGGGARGTTPGDEMRGSATAPTEDL